MGCWVIQMVDDCFHPAVRLLFLSFSFPPSLPTQLNPSLCLFYRFLSLLSPSGLWQLSHARKGDPQHQGGGWIKGASGSSSKSDPSLAQETDPVKITLPLPPVWVITSSSQSSQWAQISHDIHIQDFLKSTIKSEVLQDP